MASFPGHCWHKILGVLKAVCPWEAARFSVLEHLDNSYPNHLHVFTNGSVNPHRGVSAAAYVIPDNQVSWPAHLGHVVSSIESECIAIAAALRKLESYKPQEVVILTDSKAVLKLWQRGIPTKRVCQRFSRLVQELSSEGFNGRFQWIPSPVGVKGNETADQMARNALSFAPTVKVSADHWNDFRRTAVEHFKSFKSLSSALRHKGTYEIEGNIAVPHSNGLSEDPSMVIQGGPRAMASVIRHVK